MPNIGFTSERRAPAVALALAGAFCAALGCLAAAPARADPPAVYGARRATGEVFRDWRLRCFGGRCVLETEVAGADGAPILSLAVRGPGSAGAMTVRTPLPLFLPDGLALGLGDAVPVLAPWRTCGPAGCEAVTPLSLNLLGALRREREAEATLTLADGVRVRFPVSLIGFAAGWEAMPQPPHPPTPPQPPAPAAAPDGAAPPPRPLSRP